MRPLHNTDFYKTGHVHQYDKGTETVCANWTPRGSRIPGIDKVTFFGLQHYVKKHLIDAWQRDFFDKPRLEVVKRYRRRLQGAGPVQKYSTRLLTRLRGCLSSTWV